MTPKLFLDLKLKTFFEICLLNEKIHNVLIEFLTMFSGKMMHNATIYQQSSTVDLFSPSFIWFRTG